MKIPATFEFVDIAGLVKGASKGEGLGNKFLSHIREVDAVVQVVRCFDDKDVVHVSDTLDPVADIETIATELVLADLESVGKQKERLEKLARGGQKEAKAQLAVAEKLDPAPRLRQARADARPDRTRRRPPRADSSSSR